MNIREKLEKDYNDLEERYLLSLKLKDFEEKREVPDREYLEVLKRERILIIDKQTYIKELLEVLDNENN